MSSRRSALVGAIALVAVSLTSAAATAAATAAAGPHAAQAPLPPQLTYQVVDDSYPGVVKILVIDTSGRNVTGQLGVGTPQPTVEERHIAVTVKYPKRKDGTPRDRAFPVVVEGGYRNGDRNIGCYDKPFGEKIVVCVGFHSAEGSSPNHFDSPNDPGDVSRVLDLIETRPGIFGVMDLDHIVYVGGSRGAIAGLYFVHPTGHDPRIRAVAGSAGFAPYWIPAFSDRANWDAGPRILMTNGTADQVITYELAKKTYANAGGSGRLRLLTVLGADHSMGGSCAAVSEYQGRWVRWQLGLEDKPSRAAVKASTCGVFGPVEGGTTGDGAAGAFKPTS